MKYFCKLIFLISITLVSCSQGEPSQKHEIEIKNLSFAEISIKLMDNSIDWSPAVKKQLSDKWEMGSVPIVLEMGRFYRSSFMSQLYSMMREKTGENFEDNDRDWQNWLWQQDYNPLPKYPEFKAELYSKIDFRFADYFKNDAMSTIRLDEVAWGGVRKDGIPPLRNPKMIKATKATYLGENDVVFGIEIDGEARAYPKRILAWHEMFTDTIKGVPLAGVY